MILMPGKALQASDVLAGDIGLIEETVQLLGKFDAFPLFSRQLLAFFTDVNAMAAPTEFLVWTRPAADSAIMSHGLRPNQEAKILSIRCARSRAVSRLAAWLLGCSEIPHPW